ncbi:MAG: hemolysin family protein [Ignavibacteria bacterium]|nr:hemolysin family protein [Ignavibacteria bacterium]
MEVVSVILKIFAVLGLVFLNGFFVAAEFAIVKVRSTQIEPLAKSGSKRAKVAHSVITHLDAYLSATQLGITLTSLGLGWLGEPFVANLLQPVFVWAGITEPTVVQTASFAIGFFIITFLHIVFGELAPKSLAIMRAQSTTLAVAPLLHLFFLIFRPFIWMLNGTANFFLRKVGIQPATEGEIAHSEEELRLLLSKGKVLSHLGKTISLRAFELRDRTVREVMVPRTEVFFLSTDRSISENIAAALDNQYTRYPLCEHDLDHVLGMIHLKDLFTLKGTDGPGRRLIEIKREMLFVPETTPLEKMLTSFLARRVLMAVAVDEYGGMAGLVTLENVLEELVGEIRDEFDVEPLLVQKISDAEYLVDGTMPLHDFARMFEIVPEAKDFVTVSGYVLQLLGRLPEKGASVELGDWLGTIVSTEARKVKTLRMKKHRFTDHVVET